MHSFLEMLLKDQDLLFLPECWLVRSIQRGFQYINMTDRTQFQNLDPHSVPRNLPDIPEHEIQLSHLMIGPSSKVRPYLKMI